MSVTIKFTDKSKIIKRKIKIASDRVLRAGGPIGVQEMRSFVPIDTWSLSDTIRVTFDFQNNRLIWNAGGTNPGSGQFHDPVTYAQVVEFGRSDMPAYPAQPYFVPGLAAGVQKLRAAAIQETKSVLG